MGESPVLYMLSLSGGHGGDRVIFVADSWMSLTCTPQDKELSMPLTLGCFL